MGRRHPRGLPRRRRRVEGRAARRRPRGGAARRAVGAAAALGRPPRTCLRRVRARVLAAAAELAGRRCHPPRSALRRAARPDPGRRLLPRPPARPHAANLAPALARARRGRRRADRLGADRRLPGAAPVVARLRRARLVQGSARARLPGHLRAARELDLQHRRREQPDPPARLRLPQPARHLVRARDRAALSRRAPAHAGGP